MCAHPQRVRVMRWFHAGRCEEHLRCPACGDWTITVRRAALPVRTRVKH